MIIDFEYSIIMGSLWGIQYGYAAYPSTLFEVFLLRFSCSVPFDSCFAAPEFLCGAKRRAWALGGALRAPWALGALRAPWPPIPPKPQR